MWRMPTPTQALHYLALPASLGIVSLAIAVFLKTGFSQASATWITVGVAAVSGAFMVLLR